MSAQEYIGRVCEHRGLPQVPVGARCTVDGRPGIIVDGNSSANFNVQFADCDGVRNCHPGWKMRIFNADGSVLHDSDTE